MPEASPAATCRAAAPPRRRRRSASRRGRAGSASSTSSGIRQVSCAAAATARPRASTAGGSGPAASWTTPRTGVSTSFSQSIRRRPSCSAATSLGVAGGRAHEPADHRDARQRVHQRRDAVGIADVRLGARGGDAAVRPGSRVVPRTAWPAPRRSAASDRPRQPQPTISTRAIQRSGRRGPDRPERRPAGRRWTGIRVETRQDGRIATDVTLACGSWTSPAPTSTSRSGRRAAATLRRASMRWRDRRGQRTDVAAPVASRPVRARIPVAVLAALLTIATAAPASAALRAPGVPATVMLPRGAVAASAGRRRAPGSSASRARPGRRADRARPRRPPRRRPGVPGLARPRRGAGRRAARPRPARVRRAEPHRHGAQEPPPPEATPAPTPRPRRRPIRSWRSRRRAGATPWSAGPAPPPVGPTSPLIALVDSAARRRPPRVAGSEHGDASAAGRWRDFHGTATATVAAAPAERRRHPRRLAGRARAQRPAARGERSRAPTRRARIAAASGPAPP